MFELNKLRPAWAEINLDNLAHNFKEIKRLVGDNVLVTSVIKADAYGHGAVEVAKVLKECGSDKFAVATLSEAMELRKSGIDEDILILGYTPKNQSNILVEYDISQAIYNFENAKAISQEAEKQNKIAKIHIKVDTGMGRLGYLPEYRSIEEIVQLFKLPNIKVEGIFSHFARADEIDKTSSKEQFSKFEYFIEKLKDRGIEISIKHIANSAAVIDLPQYHLDMVRAGIILYGLYPSNFIEREKIDLKTVMTLKTTVSNLKILDAGEGISYGHKFITTRPTKIATLPIGYADGFSRRLSGKAQASIKGKRVPVVGSICMDQCMLDVSDIEDVNIGDEVILFGDGSANEPSIDEVAEMLGTINYEIVCMISRRVPRVYVKNNEIIRIKDYVKSCVG